MVFYSNFMHQNDDNSCQRGKSNSCSLQIDSSLVTGREGRFYQSEIEIGMIDQ